MTFENKLRFYLNGTSVKIDNPDPDTTLLNYIRSIGLTGTKLGCGEGGCGACTIMISSYNKALDNISHISANACLTPLCSVDGKHIITIEGIGNVKHPHPIQERLALLHGSQCGFCTPGVVMSLYSLLRNNPNPSEEEAEECFDGNLCRCTGYRPILDTAKTFARIETNDPYENHEPQENVGCGKADCCKLNNVDTTFNHNFSQIKFKKYDATQELIFPPSLMKYVPEPLHFHNNKTKWFRPINIDQLLSLKSEYPNATLVSGNTRIGIETKFENIKHDVQIYVGDIPELKSWEFKDDGLSLGANMTISRVQAVLKEACNYYKPHQIQIFEALSENLKRFATHQIRNTSTLAGNIIANSSTSDLIPLLLSSESIFSLISLQSTLKKSRPIPSVSFWTGYNQGCRASSEILESIFIPCSNHGQYVRAYKQSKRHYGSRAIVNAGLSVSLDYNSHVQKACFAFGGMRGAVVRALNAENFIEGKKWGDEYVLEQLIEILCEEFQLSFSVTGAMATYRKTLVIGFINKFWYDVTKSANIAALSSDIENSIGEIKRSISKGIQTIGRPDKGNKIVGKPISHASAMKQTTGQAIYLDDMPRIEGELYGAFVTSQKAHAKILNIDPTQALNVPGVKGFFSAKDVPGKNSWGFIVPDDEVFVSKEVFYVGQVIGLIVAETKEIAQEAKDLVKIEYGELPYILTIEEAIEQNSYFPMTPQLARGDVEQGFQKADYIFEGEARSGSQEHFYMETNVALVIPKEDDEFEVHSGTQNPAETQYKVAEVLGITANKVTCRVKRVGGAFGGKETKGFLVAMALAVGAWHLKKPIRCMLDRNEDIIITGQRHPILGRWKVGLTNDGKILAYDLKLYLNGGGTSDVTTIVAEVAILTSDGAYYIPNVRFIAYPCKTNVHSNTSFRGFGKPQALFIIESMMNDVADRMQIDINELREKNLYVEGQKTHYNQTLENWCLPSVYQQVKEASEFEKRKKLAEEFNSNNKWRKRGLALIPLKFGVSYHVLYFNQAGALVHIYLDGSVLISHGGIEMGQGLHTKMLQIASEALDVPINKVHLVECATNLVINSSPTSASTGSDLNGYAVHNACKILAERLKPYREKMPDKSFKEIVKAAYHDRVNLSTNGFYKTPDIGYDFEKNEGKAFAYYTTGAACSEVEIDTLTGDHTILRTDICMDIGRSLNYALDVGQIEGGFIQGVGWYTNEQTLHFPNGNLYTTGPDKYKIPGARDIPQDFRIYTYEGAKLSNLKTIHSSKGVGEPPLLLGCTVFFAIRDAIKAARKYNNISAPVVLRLPATPERIRIACDDEIVRRCRVEKKDGEVPWVIET
ncbi:xanthine dehydrogenase [Gigaspora rosea]|uniref:xanthine dehydrogenase n=1 Tax=Gigaspora rosea TaxID=44941 RepID=A0A397UW50_9GLOM|nr:xanthine dehydrogenase [Gigaspora rosea]